MELKEYSSEVDVEFVRKSVRAIGRCAIKLERAAERCIHKLLELIANEPEPATLPEALASVDQQGAEHQDWLVDVAAIVAVLLGWLTQQR